MGWGKGFVTFSAFPVGQRVAPLIEQHVASRLRGALAALPAPWVVLANRCASGADAPPWARFIALHPRKGIALIDIDSPDAAVAPLEDFLSRAGLFGLRDGAPPIAPVAFHGGEAGAIADRLDAALAPLRRKLGNASWSKNAVTLLLTTPDLALTRVRRVAPPATNTIEATRAAPATDPSHAVEAWHVLLARSGMLGPDSVLLEWQPRHSGRSLAAMAALLLITIGARAVQEYGPSRFQPAIPPSAAAEAPALSADVLARAMLLPTVEATLPTTVLTLGDLPAPLPKLATLAPPLTPPPQQTVVTPQPKPAMPTGFTDTDDRQNPSPQPKTASKPAAPKHFIARRRTSQLGTVVDPAWYDQGATTPSNAGLTAFVAPGARNAQLIAANLGTAQLASGTTATLDFYGDGLVNIAVNGKALARTIDPSTGKPLGAAVGNTRTLKAASGSVFVTANVAANVVDDVVNSSAVVQASSASEQNGQVVLNGGPTDSGGTVQIAGTKPPAVNPSDEEKASDSGGSPQDQAVVYTTTAVTGAQGTAVAGVASTAAGAANAIATNVGGTVTGVVAQGAADVNATTASVGNAAADAPATVLHVGGTIGTAASSLTSTVNSPAKPATSLALPGR